MASVRRDGADNARPIGREENNLRGAFDRVDIAGARGSELDEDRPGVTRRVPLGDGPDPSSHGGDDTRAPDPAQPPDLPGGLLGPPLGPGVGTSPRGSAKDLGQRIHDAIVALPDPGRATRCPAARWANPCYA